MLLFNRRLCNGYFIDWKIKYAKNVYSCFLTVFPGTPENRMDESTFIRKLHIHAMKKLEFKIFDIRVTWIYRYTRYVRGDKYVSFNRSLFFIVPHIFFILSRRTNNNVRYSKSISTKSIIIKPSILIAS